MLLLFSHCRTLLQLSVLCQRTYDSSNTMTYLLQLLSNVMSSLLQDNHTSPPHSDQDRVHGMGVGSSDHTLLQQLVLLLSHVFSSLAAKGSSKNRPNLFQPSPLLPSLLELNPLDPSVEEIKKANSRQSMYEKKHKIKQKLSQLRQGLEPSNSAEKQKLRQEFDTLVQVCLIDLRSCYSAPNNSLTFPTSHKYVHTNTDRSIVTSNDNECTYSACTSKMIEVVLSHF